MSMTITAGIALMSTFALREPGAQKTRPAAAAQDDTLQLAVGLDAARSAGLS
jgi:hypothetical protein